jgi:hypothetical protein
MPRFDAASSQVRIYPKRAGLLGAVGHDLEIGVADYHIEVAGSGLQIAAEFAAASLYVIGAVERDRPNPSALSDRDKVTIERNLHEDILEARRFPTIAFRSTSVELGEREHIVHGRLSLHGRERELRFVVARRSDRLLAEVLLHQPDFDIRPFRAFAGALRIQPELRVRIELSFTPT